MKINLKKLIIKFKALMWTKLLAFLIFFLVSSQVHAQIIDAIGGHIKDIQNRFSDHQKISGKVLKSGDIDKNAKGQDLIHNSSGTWTLIKVGKDLYLQSDENFYSSPGPDYHVYFSNLRAIKDNEQFDNKQIEVGKLQKPNGASFYKLPTEKIENVNSILIWCKQFKEYIGSADLKLTN